jgi:hypothetical protein
MESSPRPFLFCLIPADQADALLAPLREHFARESRVAVLVEQRTPSRDRRPSCAVVQGRQRAPVAERDPRRALPRELHHDALGVRFVQRMEPLDRTHEQTATSELVPMIDAHDPAAVSELWWRVAERVHVRLRAWLGEFAAAKATPEMLGRILDELDRYDPERQPLTAWLDAVVDRYARDRAGPRHPVDRVGAPPDTGFRLGTASATEDRGGSRGDAQADHAQLALLVMGEDGRLVVRSRA